MVVGLSGGVDSSVAAYLLKREGYDVIGLFMLNWEEEEGGQCSSATDWEDARAVAGRIGIPCYSVNFAKEYYDNVFKYFLEEYNAGRTPNPDVLCNREIKFKPFREYAKKLGADYIATGHYCGISHDGDTMLLKAADENKDQTYFLNQVETEQLSNTLFPLSALNKGEVRRIALDNNLVTAKKKDSTGICFIGERKFKEFLMNYLPSKKGDILDLKGNKVGVHSGLMYYTIGQRRGLGIGGVKDSDGRWYVVEKNLKDNTLIVSNGEGEELYSYGLVTHGFNTIGAFDYGERLECKAKFRYRQSEQDVTVIPKSGNMQIVFHTPQRAVTEGQYAVLYHGDRCLGGGVIDKVIKEKL